MFYRLGSDKAQEASFRLISSTNRDPMEAIKEGRLREDLYYRINTIEIHVPPLRERLEDIQNLAEHFLHQLSEKYQRPACRISEESYQRLFEHTWPGNVRELQHAIERAILLCKNDIIDVDALPFAQTATRAMAATTVGTTVTRTVPPTTAAPTTTTCLSNSATPGLSGAVRASPSRSSTSPASFSSRATAGIRQAARRLRRSRSSR